MIAPGLRAAVVIARSSRTNRAQSSRPVATLASFGLGPSVARTVGLCSPCVQCIVLMTPITEEHHQRGVEAPAVLRRGRRAEKLLARRRATAPQPARPLAADPRPR